MSNIKQMNNNLITKKFNFVNGPPFCTGLPHYGHMLTMSIKDTVLRYKRMMGYEIERRFGWDCHGVPVELLAERELQLETKSKSSKEITIEEYNNKCRELVMKYRNEWNQTIKKSGFIFDIDNDYKTMDLSYMNEVWKVFYQLYEKGLIYEGYRVLPYSYILKTPLSNFESKLNYKEVQDPSLIVKFVIDQISFNNIPNLITFESKTSNSNVINNDLTLNQNNEQDIYVLVWTTTPWTLSCNMALCVNPDADYVVIRSGTIKYLIAKERLHHMFLLYDILYQMKGSDLRGISYKSLYDDNFELSDTNIQNKVILCDSYVGLDKGTGIVHIAPAFGEDDFRVYNNHLDFIKTLNCNQSKEFLMNIDESCNFTSGKYRGKNCKSCDKEIVRDLKMTGKVYSISYEKHEYPFCWRSDTPLIYRACRSYFIRVENLKEKLIEHNQQILWNPEHVKDGRYGMWLNDIRDWCISRNRNWGNPIPIWKTEDGDIKVIKDIEELESLSGLEITDLHRDKIDNIILTIDGKQYKRTSEVMDVWLESGCVPFGINMPDVDWICEGIDQTRGWFYTLNVISSAIRDQPASKAINVCGLVLASDGEKMSKNKKNYPDVNVVLDKYGSDCLRLYLNGSQASKGNNLKFNESDLKQINQNIIIYMNNVVEFFKQSYDFVRVKYERETTIKVKSLDNLFDMAYGLQSYRFNFINKWIIEELCKFYIDIQSEMEKFNVSSTTLLITRFIDNLSRWYLNINKKVLKLHDIDMYYEYEENMNILFNIIYYTTILMSPFTPFLSDKLFDQLKLWCRIEERIEDIIIPDMKTFNITLNNSNETMTSYKEYVEIVREMRGRLKMSQKIPFKEVKFVNMKDSEIFDEEMKEYLYDAVNAISFDFVKVEDLMKNHIKFDVKVNPKVGKRRNEFEKMISHDIEFLKKNIEDDNFIFEFKISSDQQVSEMSTENLDEIKHDLQSNEIISSQTSNILIRNRGSYVIIFDTTYDEECQRIFEFKKLNRTIMNMRKTMGLVPKDKVRIWYKIQDDIEYKNTKSSNIDILNDEFQVKYLVPLLHQKILEYDNENFDEMKQSEVIEILGVKIIILIEKL